MVALVETLLGKGMELSIYDRNVSEAGLLGSNREFIERHIPHIWSLMRSDMDEVTSADTLILGNKDPEFRTLQAEPRSGQTVIDLARVFDGQVSTGNGYQGICW